MGKTTAWVSWNKTSHAHSTPYYYCGCSLFILSIHLVLSLLPRALSGKALHVTVLNNQTKEYQRARLLGGVSVCMRASVYTSMWSIPCYDFTSK